MKHKVTILVLAIITSFFSIAIFSDNYIFHSIMSSMGAQNTRIDLLNAGAKSNSVKLVSHKADKAELLSPNWFKKANGMGKVLQFKMKKRWQHYEVTLQAIGDGTLNIQFKGKDRRVNGKRYPALVDFKDVYVNGKKHIGSQKTVWHDKPHTIKVKVKDGEKIVLKMKARKHSFRISDFHKFYHTNFRMVLATFIISCLFYSFLVSMYAKGRAMGGRRTDMLFLVGFFIMLVIPMLHLSDEKRSKAENRNLAVYDPIVKNGKFNMNYGNKVDKWFGDRFYGREKVINTFSKLNIGINSYPKIKNTLYIKDSGWTFNMEKLTNKYPIDKNGVNVLDCYLKNIYKEVNDIGAKFYVMIIPSKEDVYKEYAKIYYYTENIRNESVINELIRRNKFQIIFPYVELTTGKQKDFIFFKNDMHWTDVGAYIGYKTLLNKIQYDLKNIYIAKEEDFSIIKNNFIRSVWNRTFHIGGDSLAMGFRKGDDINFLNAEYFYFEPKNHIKEYILDYESTYKFKNYKNNKEKYRLFLTGTSMNDNLLQFLPQSFNEILYTRLNGINNVLWDDRFNIFKLYKKYIEEFKPDVFVLCLTETDLVAISKLQKD